MPRRLSSAASALVLNVASSVNIGRKRAAKAAALAAVVAPPRARLALVAFGGWPVVLPSLLPRGLAACSAALVRWLINSRSC